MRFLKARSQLLISLGEPIADPFKSEKLHSGTGAKLVGTVVAYLDDVAGLVTTKESGLRFIVIVEIKERVSLLGKGSVHLMVG